MVAVLTHESHQRDGQFFLAPYVKARWSNTGYSSPVGLFGSGYHQRKITSRSFWRDLTYVAAEWIEPQSVVDLKDSILSSSNHNKRVSISVERLDQIVDFLFHHNFLMAESVGNSPDHRYSRNFLHFGLYGCHPQKTQHRLLSSRVTILGCGGIGNHIAHALATSGVGHITLVDHDRVELSNLTRQIMFTEDDIGKHKVHELKKSLEARNRSATISTRLLEIQRYTDLKDLPNSDLLVVSADHPPNIGMWVNEYCVSQRQSYIMAGYINDISVIGPCYIPGKTSCYACKTFSFHQQEEKGSDTEQRINKRFRTASFPSVNAVAAGYAVGDIMKYLGAFGPVLSANQRIGIHSVEPRIELQKIPKNPACSVCSSP